MNGKPAFTLAELVAAAPSEFRSVVGITLVKLAQSVGGVWLG